MSLLHSGMHQAEDINSGGEIRSKTSGEEMSTRIKGGNQISHGEGWREERGRPKVVVAPSRSIRQAAFAEARAESFDGSLTVVARRPFHLTAREKLPALAALCKISTRRYGLLLNHALMDSRAGIDSALNQ